LLREEAKAVPAFQPTKLQLAIDSLRGRSFGQLSPEEKETLLMVVGCQLGILAPETSEH
jgi:hypothetical protein